MPQISNRIHHRCMKRFQLVPRKWDRHRRPRPCARRIRGDYSSTSAIAKVVDVYLTASSRKRDIGGEVARMSCCQLLSDPKGELLHLLPTGTSNNWHDNMETLAPGGKQKTLKSVPRKYLPQLTCCIFHS